MDTTASTISFPELKKLPAQQPSPSSWELVRTAIDRAQRDNAKTVLYLSFTAPAGDPLVWLSNHLGVPSVYWRSKDGWEYAGMGAVNVLGGRGPEAMGRIADEAAQFLRDRTISESVPSARRPRYFGGFAFDPLRADSAEWREGGFGDAVLVLPEALFLRRESQSYFFLAFEITPRSTPDDILNRLALLNQRYWGGFHEEALSDHGPFEFEPIADEAEHRRWLDVSRRIIDQIESGVIEKVVLARRQEMTAVGRTSGPLDPWHAVKAMRNFDPSCYQFGYQFDEHYAFVGASPERLFRLASGQVECEAIAGTIGRGLTENDDSALGASLLASSKDQLELRYVVEAIEQGLRELSAEHGSTSSRVDLVRLKTLQHLRTIVRAELRAGVTVGEILTTLHPTAAVAGAPTERACALIRESETHGRGWYGGPVGWIGADSAEFAVGIRSALLNCERAWIYAGAGLVRGSNPDDEWQETCDKLQVFQRAASSRPSPT